LVNYYSDLNSMRLRDNISSSLEVYKEKFLYYLDAFIAVLLSINLLFAGYYYSIAWISLVILIPAIIFRLIIDRNLYRPDTIFIILLIIFILIQVISSLFSIDPRESLFVVRRRAMLYVLFFTSVMFIKNPVQLKQILAAFIIFSTMVSIIEIIRFISDPNRLTAPLNEFRITYFGHPVTIAEIKMLTLVLITVFLLSKETFLLQKKWLIICALPILYTFYLTGSRGAALALAGSLVVIGFMRSKLFVLSFVSAVVLFFIFAPPEFTQRLLSIGDLNGKGIASRVEMWETSFQITHDYPVFGIGSGDVIKVYERYTKTRYVGEGHQMHDNAIHLLVTTGFAGLAAWLILMLYIFIRQIKIYRRTRGNDTLNSLALASLISMIAFQIAGVFDWNYGDFAFSFVLWIFISLAFLAEKFNMDIQKA